MRRHCRDEACFRESGHAHLHSLAPFAQHGGLAGRLLRVVVATPRAGQTTVVSSPVGVVAAPTAAGQTGIAVPLTLGDVFVGVVESNAGANVVFPAVHGNVGALLQQGRAYYVEVLTGSLEGERFDVDVARTASNGGPGVVLALGSGSNTRWVRLGMARSREHVVRYGRTSGWQICRRCSHPP